MCGVLCAVWHVCDTDACAVGRVRYTACVSWYSVCCAWGDSGSGGCVCMFADMCVSACMLRVV